MLSLPTYILSDVNLMFELCVPHKTIIHNDGASKSLWWCYGPPSPLALLVRDAFDDTFKFTLRSQRRGASELLFDFLRNEFE